jgi:site-specific DNA-adenine methylase
MSYPGGKSADGVKHRIINQIPPHETYIEPFLGGGGILLNKRPAACSIGIDSDAAVIEKWLTAGHAINSDMVHNATNGDTFEGIYINGDAISFLKAYQWRGGEFVYADPPYLMSTRRSKAPLYRHEFATDEEHEELLSVLLSLPCMVAISGYWSELYASMLSSWRTINFQAGTRAGTAATEWLWMNYPEPVELHDYRYLGENFREREKITRQRRRWRARLLRMSTLQRYALLASIAELGDATR